MNWKIVVGIMVGISLVFMGFVALHTDVGKSITATVLDNTPPGTEGPHPPSGDGWQIIDGASSLNGPHPPSGDGWNQ